jgi:hypothetical protein
MAVIQISKGNTSDFFGSFPKSFLGKEIHLLKKKEENKRTNLVH